MEAQPLDLKLSDEEIAKHVTEVIDGSGPLPSAEEMARGVADAASRKAALGLVGWLDTAFADATEDKGGILNGDEVISILTDLALAFRAQGIQKPEGI